MPASSPGQRANAFDDNPETIAMECVKFNGLGSPHDSDDESEDNGDVALLRSRPRFSSPTRVMVANKKHSPRSGNSLFEVFKMTDYFTRVPLRYCLQPSVYYSLENCWIKSLYVKPSRPHDII